ncbi:glucose-6-phosphate isomerase [Litorivicinus lipolyticus]|uniref:Glucose-6-phosphate isomerase n=1 Tax=Litorivicinus lipolyticus TaxID=418701 RepID=A0A5Q2QC95_9GAMM|nr:glucose-6-phosphate isomerase [Litorivicinus lipolyticus]QGG79912.1 glucose-6-phosphate isomerase [Litorivicinus lipolyticus]
MNELKALAQSLSETSLNSLMNPQRTAQLTLDAGPWRVDLSKHFLTDASIAALKAWCDSRDVQGAISDLFAGLPLNLTEGRAVMHMAMRAEAGDDLKADGEAVMDDVLRERERCLVFAERVRSGQHTGATGARIERVINIGIGGSDLGPRMAVEALAPDHDGPDVRFVANVDPSDLYHALDGADPARTLVIVASKTFTTIETLTNARAARAWLVAELGEAAVADHFVALSTAQDKVAAFGIGPAQTFGFWDWVGGRYSLWSAIGLPIMIAIGRDAFCEFLAGARDMDQHVQQTPFERNLPVMLGALYAWYRQYWDKPSVAVIPYDQHLSELPAYLQQADMESLGKRVDRQGQPIHHATGAVVWGEPGTNGQHAFFQLLHQGSDWIPVEFIVPVQARLGAQSQHDLLVANALAQGEALLVGKDVDTARAEMAGPDGMDLGPHRTFPGSRPSTLFLTPSMTPRALGALVAMHEHRIFVQGWLWNLNAYDQWGVELGKALALSAADALASGDTEGKDASTAAAIDWVRQNRG